MQTSFSLAVRGKTLRGIAHLPEKENCPCLVLCHGLTGCAHERPLMAIAKELEKNGVVCLRHDCIGSGESDGLPEEATFHRGGRYGGGHGICQDAAAGGS